MRAKWERKGERGSDGNERILEQCIHLRFGWLLFCLLSCFSLYSSFLLLMKRLLILIKYRLKLTWRSLTRFTSRSLSYLFHQSVACRNRRLKSLLCRMYGDVLCEYLHTYLVESFRSIQFWPCWISCFPIWCRYIKTSCTSFRMAGDKLYNGYWTAGPLCSNCKFS